jgi:hypothetical protein
MDTAISINGFYRNAGDNSKSHIPIRVHGTWPICRAVVWPKNFYILEITVTEG